jgi:hypothetical protein
VIHLRGVEDHLYLISRMDADSDQGNGSAERGFMALLHYL